MGCRRHACHYRGGVQETGGACASMLSCRTDSAKLMKRGGPVSRSSIATGKRAGGGKTCAAKVCVPTIRTAFPVTFAVLATTARTSLQHGVFGAGFFFEGATCIGQPLIADSD